MLFDVNESLQYQSLAVDTDLASLGAPDFAALATSDHSPAKVSLEWRGDALGNADLLSPNQTVGNEQLDGLSGLIVDDSLDNQMLSKSGTRLHTEGSGSGGSSTGSTNTYRDGDRVITEHFDANGYFLGAVYRNDDGSGSWWSMDGRSGSWGADTGYWAVGGALGIGFGLWGTGNGDWGISWNAGIGGYVLVGEADSAGAAIQEVTEDRIVIGVEVEDVPTQIEVDPHTGRVTYGGIGFSFGIFASDPETSDDYDPAYDRSRGETNQ